MINRKSMKRRRMQSINFLEFEALFLLREERNAEQSFMLCSRGLMKIYFFYDAEIGLQNQRDCLFTRKEDVVKYHLLSRGWNYENPNLKRIIKLRHL